MSDDIASGTDAAFLRRMTDNIENYGWYVIAVMEENDLPAFAYTIGLYQQFAHPEGIIVGLSVDTMHSLLNTLGQELKEGKSYKPGVASSDFLNGADCSFGVVHPTQYEEYFGQAIRYYEHSAFPALQLYWPDKQGWYPSDPRFDPSLRTRQPDLSLPLDPVEE